MTHQDVIDHKPEFMKGRQVQALGLNIIQVNKQAIVPELSLHMANGNTKYLAGLEITGQAHQHVPIDPDTIYWCSHHGNLAVVMPIPELPLNKEAYPSRQDLADVCAGKVVHIYLQQDPEIELAIEVAREEYLGILAAAMFNGDNDMVMNMVQHSQAIMDRKPEPQWGVRVIMAKPYYLWFKYLDKWQ